MSDLPMCAHCEKHPASCLGCYEDHSREDCPHEGCTQHGEDYACDHCCGHCNEDGYCWALADIPGVVQTLDVNLTAATAERDRLRLALTITCRWFLGIEADVLTAEQRVKLAEFRKMGEGSP